MLNSFSVIIITNIYVRSSMCLILGNVLNMLKVV